MELVGRFLNLMGDPETQEELTRLHDQLGSLLDSSAPVPPVMLEPRRRVGRLTASDEQELVAAYQAGSKIDDLAQRFGFHRTTVMACLTREQVPRRQRGLESKDLSEVIRLYGAGWSSARLAKRFGVDARTVLSIPR
jgi:uncharacterized protein (DUF433 family)